MSDTADEFYSKQLLRKSTANPMRDRMEEFVEDHPRKLNLKELRTESSKGGSLSNIVIEGREERF